MEFTVKGIVYNLPSSPRVGDAYIVHNTTSVTHEQVAKWNGTRWAFTIPNIGDNTRVVSNEADESWQFYDTGWEFMGSPKEIIAS